MGYGNRIRVMVMHDDPVVRVGLSAAFGKYPDLELVDVEDEPGIGALGPWSPTDRSADVVVSDYENGIELAKKVVRRPAAGGAVKVMILAPNDREWAIRHAMECGVRGYLVVGCGLDDLASGVRAVHRGVRYLSPQATQRLAECMSGESLTAREEEVLRLVVEGLGNKLIARRLNIAVGTVKSHLKGVFSKLDVDSRTQAICAAERRGLLRDVSLRSHDRSIARAITPKHSRVPDVAHELDFAVRASIES